MISLILGKAVKAAHDIANFAVLIGNVDGLDDAAVVGDLDGGAGGVGHYIQVGFTAAGQLAKGLLYYAHEG